MHTANLNPVKDLIGCALTPITEASVTSDAGRTVTQEAAAAVADARRSFSRDEQCAVSPRLTDALELVARLLSPELILLVVRGPPMRMYVRDAAGIRSGESFEGFICHTWRNLIDQSTVAMDTSEAQLASARRIYQPFPAPVAKLICSHSFQAHCRPSLQIASKCSCSRLTGGT